MQLLFSILLFFTFIVLSGLHFYWITGGKWALDHAVPTLEDGDKIFNPDALATIIVAIGLLIFAMFYLVQSGLFFIQLPNWLLAALGWGVPSIFLLRAFGDFTYLGFFKRIKDTSFARKDTQIYSPLCLAIGIAGLIVQVVL